MSSRTPRLRLYKPADDGSENVVVATDLNDNLELLDTFVGWSPVTAGTYPASGYQGQAFIQTDTGKGYVNVGVSGSALSLRQLVTASARFDSALTVNAAISSSGSSGFFHDAATSSDVSLGLRVLEEAQHRFRLFASGRMEWGAGGSSARDVALYRASADVLALDDALTVGSTLTVGGATSMADAAVSGNFSIGSARFRPVPSAVTTVSNSSAEATLASMTIPAADAAVGAVYRIKAWGTCVVTGTPTVIFRTRIGGLAGTALASLAAITVRSGATDGYWSAEVLVTCVTTGASGTWAPIFEGGHNFTGAVTTYTRWGPIASVANITRDSTAAQDLVITGQFNAASSSNILVCKGFAAERVA